MKAFENVALRQLRWGLVRGCRMGWVNAPKAFAKAKAALTYKPDSIQSTPALLLTFDIGVYEPSLHRISRNANIEWDLIAIVPAQLREPFKKLLSGFFSVKWGGVGGIPEFRFAFWGRMIDYDLYLGYTKFENYSLITIVTTLRAQEALIQHSWVINCRSQEELTSIHVYTQWHSIEHLGGPVTAP